MLSPYQAPSTPTPHEWKNQPEDSSVSFEACKEDLEHWWEIFEDPLLDQLEKQALEESYTLWSTLERVIQARAVARIDRAALFPQINFNPSFSRSGMLLQNLLGDEISNLNQTGQQTCPPVPQASQPTLPSVFRAVQTQYMLPFDLSYEVDLWGKLRNTFDSSVFTAQAAAQNYLSVLLTLTADIASHFYQLRSLDRQIEILERTIEVRERSLQIMEARFHAGLIVYIDVARAQVELSRAEADLMDIKRLRGLQENTLASLVGVPAPIFSLPFHPLQAPPPQIPAGIPSDLLLRRPDIAEAERRLAAAHAEIGVAYASFFPSVNVGATLGLESPVAHSLLSWKARLWEVGLNVMQSVFDAGRNCANLAYTESLFRETYANYQESVLTAFQDVEDSLVSIRQRRLQERALEQASNAARKTLELSQMRYNRGLVNYLDVVDAERTLLETEQNSIIVLGERYVSSIRLIKALGGGWGSLSECPEN